MLFRSFSKFKKFNSEISFISLCFLGFVAWPTLAVAENPKILVYGDSLSAAYGIPQQQGWAVLLKEKLSSERLNYEVVNASISGETTDGGLNRIESTLRKTNPEIIILELGANDGLRGLPIRNIEKNLGAMIAVSKQSGVKVLLLGMKIPPNYGKKYTEEFNQIYFTLAKAHQIPLVSFMLNNIAGKANLIQHDGLHPNAAAQPIILQNIWSKLNPLISK